MLACHHHCRLEGKEAAALGACLQKDKGHRVCKLQQANKKTDCLCQSWQQCRVFVMFQQFTKIGHASCQRRRQQFCPVRIDRSCCCPVKHVIPCTAVETCCLQRFKKRLMLPVHSCGVCPLHCDNEHVRTQRARECMRTSFGTTQVHGA